MSKKRTIQRAAQANGRKLPKAESSSAPQRSAFSITLTFDPAHPQRANVSVMPLGDAGGAHIDDVVIALRMGYEQALLQKGALLLQQQRQQANAAPADPNA